MEYTVYIRQSQTNGKTCVGQSADLKRRLEQHNDPECRFTLHTKRHKGPWLVIHTETFATRSEAMRREKVRIHDMGASLIHKK